MLLPVILYRTSERIVPSACLVAFHYDLLFLCDVPRRCSTESPRVTSTSSSQALQFAQTRRYFSHNAGFVFIWDARCSRLKQEFLPFFNLVRDLHAHATRTTIEMNCSGTRWEMATNGLKLPDTPSNSNFGCKFVVFLFRQDLCNKITIKFR